MRILGLLLALLWAIPAAAQGLPEYRSVYVNDFANVLSDEAEAELTTLLSDAKTSRDLEMTVVTIARRTDYGSYPDIASFGVSLFNKWGVGNATRNDGIMLIVAVEDRDMRIALGSGYHRRSNRVAQGIIDDVMIPEFRAGQMERGILRGTRASLQELKLGTPDMSGRPWKERLNAFVTDYPAIGIPLVVLGFFGSPFIILLGPFIAYAKIRRLLTYLPRKCPECGRAMLRLGDVQEDQYLSAGQIMEEQLDAKNYGVWFCTHDEHLTVVGYPQTWSRHSACDKCGYHTSEAQVTVVKAATTTATGVKRVAHSCANCGHAHEEERVTPKVQRSRSSSSSSSGSSSSSFGGGSSSGGGASGSW